ncbi:SDR family NAD(P)-dependent oxidoreductase [Paenibacillus elgii]
MKSSEPRTGLEIAVIGMAGRFPGARNIEQFWDNLVNGVESVTFLTEEELEQAGVRPETYRQKDYVKSCGCVLEDKDRFDAAFFGYTPAEAEIMHPQSRIFHECAWEALEHAGYDPLRYGQRIGLFAAASSSFGWEITTRLSGKRERLGDYASWLLDSRDFLPTRVSYKLNLTGPSVLLNTTCSSSLVAIDAACRSLLTGQCEMALAGGVSIVTDPKEGYLYQEGMILSPDGHCRAFDAEAKGTIGGEGAGLVVLKPLEDALRDRDHILAVIKGFAANNDGNRKIGYTAPGTIGQSEAIALALGMAGVDPESVTYVETHGTGTVLGDPVEIKALSSAFASSKKQFCRIGSVKTNIGHLDEGAGIAGLIKTVLALQHRVLPPSLNFAVPNPMIHFEDTPFYVNEAASKWESERYPLRAGVSSFGIGGTNAHLVLEEAPPLAESEAGQPEQESAPCEGASLLLFSARTATALEQATVRFVDYLRANPEASLSDAAFTLQIGRAVWEHRRALAASNAAEAIERLTANDPAKVHTSVSKDEALPIVFLFPGQGSQYVEMGKALYENEPVFRQELDRCLRIIGHETNEDFKSILYPEALSGDVGQKINETRYAQPLLFSFEYALASLLINWGIAPSAMIGHSLGEYVAACVSGVMTLEEALRLVVIRGRLMQSMPHGAMLSVQRPEEEMLRLLRTEVQFSGVSVAVINSPMHCVVSGPEEAIRLLEEKLTEQACPNFRVHTSHAFHSPMMAPMVPAFKEAFEQVSMKEPAIPYLSNVSGTWMEAGQTADPDYWTAHLLSTVRFSDGLLRLLRYEQCVLIEVGPGRSLSGFIHQLSQKTERHRLLNLVRHPKESTADDEHLIFQIGKLWTWGVRIDWEQFHRHALRRRIPLPSYPFEGGYYWLQADIEDMAARERTLFSGTKEPLDHWFYVPVWKQDRSLAAENGTPRSIARALLFAGTDGGLEDKLQETLQARGVDVTVVYSGESYARLADRAYTLRAAHGDDYDRLFSALEASGQGPDLIVHAWEVGGGSAEGGAAGRSRDGGLFPLLRIPQSIGRQRINRPVEVIVMTTGVHHVTGEEPLCYERAAALGAVRVIPLEYANITCRSVDVVTPASGVWDDRLVRMLADEMTSGLEDELVVYRGTSRWTQTIEKMPLRVVDGVPSLLRKQGVYMIAGGLGGIGLAIAVYLLKELQAKVLILSRTLSADRLKRAEKLKSIGGAGEFMILQADVTDAGQLQKAVSDGESRFGAIHGVFHAAGLPDGGLMQFRSDEDSWRVLGSKMDGTANLYRLFQPKGLDFLLLCSSISSVLAPIGQVAYCAANNVLDSFASACFADGSMRVLSINWDTWRDTGMALEAEKQAMKAAAPADGWMLEDGLLAAEGIEALKRILHTRLPQVIVSATDLHGRMRVNRKDAILAGLREESAQQGSVTAAMEDREAAIAAIWREHLGFEQIGVHDNFFDLGASSLDLIQIRMKIIDKLQVEIGIVDLYTYTTISSLCKFMEGEQGREQDAEEESAVLARQGDDRRQNRLQQRKRQIRGGD